MSAASIPEIIDSPHQEEVAVRPTERGGSSGPGEHILVVDDDAMIVQTGKEMLELLGYRVTTRADGLEALETVRREPGSFHLVITDFVMPRMNGLELAREVMRLRPDLPVILFTGCGKGITARKAREAGLADYLIKPLRIGEIRRAIRRALDAKQPGEAAGSA